jgi:hypothetical protein
LDDWELLFDNCRAIFDNSSNNYKLQENLGGLLHILAKQDQALYIQVLEKYLELSNPFVININLADLIKILGKEQAYKLLQKYSYNLKNFWLFNFFQHIPDNLTEKDDITEILNLYQNVDLQSIPYHIGFLSKYIAIDPDIFIKVSKILKDRATNENIAYIRRVGQIFNSYSVESKNIEIYFKNDLDLLKEVYLLCLDIDSHFDHDLKSLYTILKLDLSFLNDFLHKIFDNKKYISPYDIHLDFNILYLRDDYKKVFYKIIEIIFLFTKIKKYILLVKF